MLIYFISGKWRTQRGKSRLAMNEWAWWWM